MGAHADMTDDSFLLLLFHIGQKFSFHDPVKFCLFIYKMDHTQIYIICLQPCQQV